MTKQTRRLRSRARSAAGLLLAASTIAALPGAVSGQVSRPSDFLLERPNLTLGFRGGMFFHRAESDLYAFADDRFTLDRSDFRGVSIGIEGAGWVGDHLEVSLGMDGSRVTLRSEDADYVEEDGSPIRQTTRVTHGPTVSFGARYFLLARGEEIGRFVWIPTRINAFVGGGAAVSGYRVEMNGDFVDELDLLIYTASLSSSGAVFLPYVSTGLELTLTPRMAISFEGRYHWGSAELGRDFSDDAGQSLWEPFDLSGARITMGLSFRL